MSDKQQKILEMAKDICRVKHICNDVCKPISACDALRYAERAVEAGYVKQEWISVDERLPEENGRYLVNVNISHLAFENLFMVAIMAYGISHGFYLFNDTEKVTHWMLLPEPPKMKGGKDND